MDIGKSFAVFVLVTVIVTCAVAWFSNWLNYKSCANNVTEMSRPFRYDMTNGCRIGLKDGTFVYWKLYRDVDINK